MSDLHDIHEMHDASTRDVSALGGPRRSRPALVSRRVRRLLAIGAVVVAGGVAAGCGGAGPSASSGPSSAVLTSSTSSASSTGTTTTTTTALPECGATRDPFDPTDSAAPAGSPARC